MLLSAAHISKYYGIKQLLMDTSLYLKTGDKAGIMEYIISYAGEKKKPQRNRGSVSLPIP